MPKLITGKELASTVKSQGFIKFGVPGNVEGIKYDFSLSNHILKSEFGRPVQADELDATDRRRLRIDPGEVVFVLTQEHLELPNDVVAHLSPKRKLSHLGILTLGGFTIDPGYAGPLLVGLLNIAGTPFPLIPGKKLIAATFQKLEGDELEEFPVAPKMPAEFPDELIQVMQKYSPVQTHALASSIEVLERELTQLRSELRSHDTWYKEFERISTNHETKIGELLQGLNAERDARIQGEDKLSRLIERIDQRIEPLSSQLSYLKGAAWVIGVLLAIIIIPVLLTYFGKWIESGQTPSLPVP